MCARLAAGVDVGGSHIAAGVVDDAWRVVSKRTVGLSGPRGPRAVAETAARLLLECLGGERVAGVGIGLPGLVRQPEQTVAIAPNLGWRDAEVAEEFRAAMAPVTDSVALDNDANLAALGEWACGAGRGHGVVVCVTVGTGIGAGIVIDGRVYHGASGFAGEIGHVKVVDGGEPCGCGGEGCLETVASGTAVARDGSEALGRTVSAREVFDAAREGNAAALEVVGRAGRLFGRGLSFVVNLVDPDLIVVG
ncbi:MAG: ROK family protein, partial [Firmicutes bacterium]|nr:ROK family protein [Bacillota bacterium]